MIMAMMMLISNTFNISLTYTGFYHDVSYSGRLRDIGKSPTGVGLF